MRASEFVPIAITLVIISGFLYLLAKVSTQTTGEAAPGPPTRSRPKNTSGETIRKYCPPGTRGNELVQYAMNVDDSRDLSYRCLGVYDNGDVQCSCLPKSTTAITHSDLVKNSTCDGQKEIIQSVVDSGCTEVYRTVPASSKRLTMRELDQVSA